MYPNLKIRFMAFRVQIINKKITVKDWLGREGGLRGWDRFPTLTGFFYDGFPNTRFFHYRLQSMPDAA